MAAAAAASAVAAISICCCFDVPGATSPTAIQGEGGRGHSGFKEGTPTSPLPRRIIGTPCSSSYCRRLPLQIPALRTGLHRQNKSVRISRAPRATQLDLGWARSRAQLTFFFLKPDGLRAPVRSVLIFLTHPRAPRASTHFLKSPGALRAPVRYFLNATARCSISVLVFSKSSARSARRVLSTGFSYFSTI